MRDEGILFSLLQANNAIVMLKVKKINLILILYKLLRWLYPIWLIDRQPLIFGLV